MATNLHYRRLRARGVSSRLANLWTDRKWTGGGNRATLTLGTGNAQLQYLARVPGTAGNAITVRYVTAGANTPLSVSVAGSAITVNLATNGSSVATSTAIDVAKAIRVYNSLAGNLVTVFHPKGSDGTGVVAAVAATNLAGAA